MAPANVKKQKKKDDFRLPDKEAEQKTPNKLCVDIILPYVIGRKGQKKTLI